MNIDEFNNLSDGRKISLLNDLEVSTWFKRIIALLLLITVSLLAGGPIYGVWSQGLKGEAELSRAEKSRKIVVEEARALKDSAQLKADAEAIRATGVKKANETIAEGLGGPEGYLRYLYIDALQSTSCETIYVPTEAGLPILEATRRH